MAIANYKAASPCRLLLVALRLLTVAPPQGQIATMSAARHSVVLAVLLAITGVRAQTGAVVSPCPVPTNQKTRLHPNGSILAGFPLAYSAPAIFRCGRLAKPRTVPYCLSSSFWQ